MTALPLTQSEAPMPWVKLDDKVRNHPKILAAGSLAAWQWVAGLGYSSEFLTDGFIPASALQSLVPNQSRVTTCKLAERLVAVGLWTRAAGGYQIHDFLDYNPTAEQVRASRRAARDRQSRHRNAVTVPSVTPTSRRDSTEEANKKKQERQRNRVVLSDDQFRNHPELLTCHTSVTPLSHDPDPTRPIEAKKQKQGRPHVVLSDDQFLDSLRANPAYQGLDIDREMGKLDAWLLTPRGRGKQKTRGRVVNWLNGADKPMPAAASADPYAKFPRSAP